MSTALRTRLLRSFAMRVRALFKNIDEVIATIKTATIKNKDRKKAFHDAGLPSSPDPVITSWKPSSCSYHCKDYIKKQQSNYDLETIINYTNLTIDPNYAQL